MALSGIGRIRSSLAVLDFVQLGSSLSMRSLGRLGSAVALFGIGRMGSSMAVLDFVHLGSSLAMRSLGRLGSAAAAELLTHGT